VITKLIIDNFKAIEHLELDLRPFQVFVGPNDSGKSTILQALDLLSRSTTLEITPSSSNRTGDPRVTSSAMRRPGPELPPPPGLFEDGFERYLPHGDVARTMALEIRGTCAEGNYTYRIRWSAAKRSPRFVFEEIIVADKRVLVNSEEQPTRSLLSQKAQEFPEIHAELRSFVARFDPQKLAAHASLGSQLESDGTGLASLVDDLLTASDRQPLLDFEKQLRRFSSFIGGVGTQPTSDKRGKELIYSLAGTKRPISAKQASTGLVLVTAYLALRYGTSYRRYLIEEPENGIHPHAASLVVQVLRELSLAGAQVLITTHSPLLLNQVSPEDVMVVTRQPDRGVVVKPMVETKLFAERIRDFDLGELWYNIGEDELVAAS
jgi:predicted ATPase